MNERIVVRILIRTAGAVSRVSLFKKKKIFRHLVRRKEWIAHRFYASSIHNVLGTNFVINFVQTVQYLISEPLVY